MSKSVLFFHIVNSIHQKTNLYILFYHLNLDMHGTTMRPDFHEGIPFQQVSGNFVSQHCDSVTDSFQLDLPTKVLLPSVIQANRRQSSAEKQRKETELDSFTKQWERWELLLQIGALPGLCFRVLASGKGGGVLSGVRRRSCASLGWAPHHCAGGPLPSSGIKVP